MINTLKLKNFSSSFHLSPSSSVSVSIAQSLSLCLSISLSLCLPMSVSVPIYALLWLSVLLRLALCLALALFLLSFPSRSDSCFRCSYLSRYCLVLCVSLAHSLFFSVPRSVSPRLQSFLHGLLQSLRLVCYLFFPLSVSLFQSLCVGLSVFLYVPDRLSLCLSPTLFPFSVLVCM